MGEVEEVELHHLVVRPVSARLVEIACDRPECAAAEVTRTSRPVDVTMLVTLAVDHRQAMRNRE